MRKVKLLHSAGRACALSAALTLAACGGGGAGAGTETTPNKPPTAAAKLTGEAVLNASTVFDTVGTGDPDGSIATRLWAYGDGKTGAVDNHVYTAPGSYTATSFNAHDRRVEPDELRAHERDH